jgi:hypothetical protein
MRSDSPVTNAASSDAELARRIRADERVAPPTRPRGCVDDPASCALFDHLAGGLAAAEEDAAQVHLDEPVPRLGARIDHGADRDRPRVVDHDVEPPEGGNRSLHRPLDVALVGDVAGDPDRMTFVLRNLVDGACDRLGMQRQHADRRTLVGEATRDRVADPARASGHQGDLAVQTVHEPALRNRPRRSSAGSSTERSAA